MSSALGAEVLGLDLSASMRAQDFAKVHHAFLQHLVLVFRGQNLHPAAQVAFSERFGPLDKHPADDAVLSDYPYVLVVSTRRENGRYVGLPDAGPMWHSDLAYRPRTSLGSMLYAIEVPAAGGDTGFANMYLAYERMPAELRKAVEGRRAVFLAGRNNETRSFKRGLTQAQKDRTPPVTHPVIRTHPETGRKSVFVSAQHTVAIDGMGRDESDAVLDEIFALNNDPEIQYFHRWQVGDLVFWDNRCTQHIADLSRLEDASYVRHLHRTSIVGDQPF